MFYSRRHLECCRKKFRLLNLEFHMLLNIQSSNPDFYQPSDQTGEPISAFNMVPVNVGLFNQSSQFL